MSKRRYIWMYVLYFCGWGLFVPYFTFFLVEDGYQKATVTWAFTLLPMMTMLSPFIFGNLVDRKLERRPTMAVLLALAGAVFWVFLFHPPTWALFLLMACFGFFLTPVLPMSDAMTLRNVRSAYGVIRAMGTLAFLITSLVAGLAQNWIPTRIILGCFPILLWATAASLRRVPDLGYEDRAEPRHLAKWGEVVRSVRSNGLAPFFAFGLLHWVAMTPYNILFSVYLQEMLNRQGYETTEPIIGLAWALSTVTEFFFLLLSNRLIRKFGGTKLFASVVIFSVIRWALFAMASPVWVILAGQTMHCFVFAAFYILSTRLIASQAPPKMRNSYQTLWVAFVFGFGGVFGGLITGWLSKFYPVETIYWLSAVSALLSALPLSVYLFRRPIEAESLIVGIPES